MKRFILVLGLALLAASSATAAAPRWTWTEPYAEARLQSKLVIPPTEEERAEYEQQLAYAQEVYDDRKAALEEAEASQEDPVVKKHKVDIARSNLNAGVTLLQSVKSKAPQPHRPLEVDCRGYGPAYSGGFRYAWFRCRLQYDIGWMKILAHVTGQRTFTYQRTA